MNKPAFYQNGQHGIGIGTVELKVKKSVNYLLSNEDLTPIAKGIKFVKNTEHYVGICGGGTQNLFLLALLKKQNSLKSITLVDNVAYQLTNFFDVINLYNNYSGEKYTNKILNKARVLDWFRFRIRKAFRNRQSGHFLTTCVKPTFKTKIEINLREAEITKYLGSSNLPAGKYIIYLSNVLTYIGMSSKLTNKLVRRYVINIKRRLRGIKVDTYTDYIIDVLGDLIANNKMIHNGSFIIVYLGFWRFFASKHDIIILKKTENKISLVFRP